MSRVDMKLHTTLLKEAGVYFKDIKPMSEVTPSAAKEPIVLTQEHIYEWLEVFYEDRIRMDTCNQATVKM